MVISSEYHQSQAQLSSCLIEPTFEALVALSEHFTKPNILYISFCYIKKYDQNKLNELQGNSEIICVFHRIKQVSKYIDEIN